MALITQPLTGSRLSAVEGGANARPFGGDQMKATEDSLLDPKVDAARIRAFFVHPQWARRGIGKRIILMCEDAAQQDGFQTMELVATMPGEPLYAALGYQVTRRFEVAMADGVALPVAQMVKRLVQG